MTLLYTLKNIYWFSILSGPLSFSFSHFFFLFYLHLISSQYVSLCLTRICILLNIYLRLLWVNLKSYFCYYKNCDSIIIVIIGGSLFLCLTFMHFGGMLFPSVHLFGLFQYFFKSYFILLLYIYSTSQPMSHPLGGNVLNILQIRYWCYNS